MSGFLTTLRLPAGPNDLFAEDAFAAAVAEQHSVRVTIAGPWMGGQGSREPDPMLTAKLVAAEVVDNGRAALLTIRIPDPAPDALRMTPGHTAPLRCKNCGNTGRDMRGDPCPIHGS